MLPSEEVKDRLRIHDDRRWSILKKAAHLAAPDAVSDPEADMTDSDEIESNGSGSDSDAKDKVDRSISPISFASDSEDDPPSLPSQAKSWRSDQYNRKLLRTAREYARATAATVGGHNGDIFQDTRDEILETLNEFAPNAHTQPFVAAADTISFYMVREIYIRNSMMVTMEKDKAGQEDNEGNAQELETLIAALRERIHVYKQEQKICKDNHRDKGKRPEPRIYKSVYPAETYKKNQEIRELQADLSKRNGTIAKKDEIIAELQAAMTQKTDRQNRQTKEQAEEFKRYKDKALQVFDRKDNEIKDLRMELLGLADGTIHADLSKIVAYERKRRQNGPPLMGNLQRRSLS
ncbi:hypothetical protein CF326_g2079 [Tilletia indica]|nr:hypothetical protein CF326_g2079 [Tilletia indica]